MENVTSNNASLYNVCRRNGRCKGCGKAHTTVAGLPRTKAEEVMVGRYVCRVGFSEKGAKVPFFGSSIAMVQCECGRIVSLLPVRGKYNPKKLCNARCLAACGPSCECSCGGANHGAGGHAH